MGEGASDEFVVALCCWKGKKKGTREDGEREK